MKANPSMVVVMPCVILKKDMSIKKIIKGTEMAIIHFFATLQPDCTISNASIVNTANHPALSLMNNQYDLDRKCFLFK